MVALQLIAFPMSPGLFLRGVIVGGLTALVALGMALTYRSNRVVSFAQGDLGTMPVVLTFLLLSVSHWPYPVAVIVGVIAALGLGALVDFVVIRRFARAPRLLLTVATIGLAQLLAFGALMLPRLWGIDLITSARIAPPFDLTLNVGSGLSSVRFNANDVIALVVAPIAIALLAAGLRFSSIGVAVRASADDGDRAAMLGIPVRRVQTVVWAVAGLLAFVAVFLRAGVLGLPLDSALSFNVLLRALTALVLGGMIDLVGITLASVALGILEIGIASNSSRPGVTDAVFAAVVFVALLVVRSRRDRRVDLDDTSSWQAADEVRPVPPALRRVSVVRATRVILGLTIAAVALLLPQVLSVDRSLKASAVLIYALVGLSLVVLTGWAGQVSLGQVGFFALGAALGAKATLDWGLDLSLALLLTAAAGAVVAIVVGLPALRSRGFYLAVTTLAFSLAATSYLLRPSFFDWIPTERVPRPPLFGRIDIDSASGIYYLVLGVLVLTLLALNGVRHSRSGRAMLALRDNERGAQAYGLSATRVRLMAFAMSGAIASMAGCLLAHHQQAYDPSLFTPADNLVLFTMVVVGGVASPMGAILGALYLQGCKWFLPAQWQLLASGGGVLLVLLLMPGGLGGLVFSVRDRLLQLVARRWKVDAPGFAAAAREAPDDHLEPIIETAAANGLAPATTGRPLLEVHGLDVRYGSIQVLFGIDLTIEEGSCVALLGTNGAGKSTLLRAICGVVDAYHGSVVFAGDDITNRRPERIAAMGIAQVPGGRGIFPSLTVEENLRSAGWLLRRRHSEAEAGVDRVYAMFPALAARRGSPAGDLSGGQQQMLALGMAFLSKPRLLLVDELSLGLAPVIVTQLLPILEEMRAEGTTVILVEQSVNVALSVADTAMFMEKGEIRFRGPTAALLERPDVLRSVFLEGATRGFETNGDGAAAKADGAERTVDADVVPALELRGLTCSFGGIQAVSSVGLSVAPGEIVGIIGPNGAGKTTLFDIVSGITPAEHGTITIAGVDVTHRSPSGRAREGLGRSFQDARLFPSLTVSESIAVACERFVSSRDPMSAALHLPNAFDAERDVATRVDELIALLELGPYRGKFIRELSTGTRRIVDLACLLAHRPSVILLDEPSSGIAQRETEALGPLLLQIRDATGASLVVVEHDMPLIRSVSDRLVAMDQGAVIATGPPDAVLTDPLVVASYLGDGSTAIRRSGAPAAATIAPVTATASD